MLQRQRAVLVLLALTSAVAMAEDAPASVPAVQSLRGSATQAGVPSSLADGLAPAALTAQAPAERVQPYAGGPMIAAAPDMMNQSEQVPDYRYFCKHDPDAKSYYSNCSTCVGEVLCCDANQAVASDKHGPGGKRCTKERYGVVGLEKCALQAVPPACPYEFFCKQDAGRESYYHNCDENCVDTPICCNTDTTTLETDMPWGKRCMEGYPGHVSFSMCQARQLPERCPRDKYQYFCKHDPDKQSHYLNCDTCVGEPICCDVDQADTSQLDRNTTGGKRCTKENYGVQDMSKCAGQPVPEACQYRYFCKHDSEKMSYYSNCETCVDTPICCNMAASTLDTIFNGTRRCYEGSPGHADFSMCGSERFPAACPVSTTTTTSTTSTTTSTTTMTTSVTMTSSTATTSKTTSTTTATRSTTTTTITTHTRTTTTPLPTTTSPLQTTATLLPTTTTDTVTCPFGRYGPKPACPYTTTEIGWEDTEQIRAKEYNDVAVKNAWGWYGVCGRTSFQHLGSHRSCSVRNEGVTKQPGNVQYFTFEAEVDAQYNGNMCGGKANSCAGPSLDSKHFTAEKGAQVQISIKANAGGDYFEAMVNVLRCDAAGNSCVIADSPLLWRGNVMSDYGQVDYTFKATGDYRLRFHLGSYDYTGGTWLGANMYVKPFQVAPPV